MSKLVQELLHLGALGCLVDLFLDDGFLHCLLDDLGLLHFDCVDDVLNMRDRNLLRLFWSLSDKHLNDLLNE